MDYLNELSKYGLDEATYKKVLEEINNKMNGISDLEWADIVDKYNIKCHYDVLRKASQTIFGGYFVTNYLKSQNCTTTNIESIKQTLGEQYLVKQQIHNDRLKLNRFKRELVPYVTVAEELAKIQEDNGFEVIVPEYCYEPLTDNSEYTMILPISDWHIGYVINNCSGNSYNWEIAQARVYKYLRTALDYIERYKITNCIVVNCGDTLEHTYMRPTQSQHVEFLQSEQINKAIKLIFELLVGLAKQCNVEYFSLAGNHDRSNGDKKQSLVGDNANVIITEQLDTYTRLSQNCRIHIHEYDPSDEIILEVQHLLFKFVHGDKTPRLTDDTFAKVISSDNILYDVLVMGHWHNFSCKSENHGRYVITNGCLSGMNDYSKNFYCTTDASQTLIIVGSGEIELIKDVNLGGELDG